MTKSTHLNRRLNPDEKIMLCVTENDVARMAKRIGIEPLDRQDLDRVGAELVGCDWAARVTGVLEQIKKERDETYLKSL